MPIEKRIGATTLSEPELRNIIRSLTSPRAEGGAEGRFHKLHQLIRQREEHFFNDPAADPLLPDPHRGEAEPYQSDILRQTHNAMRVRMTENPYRIRVTPPKERPNQQSKSDQLEKVLQLGLELVENRENFSILESLADGMGKDCFGVLHWQLASDLWPEVPDAEIHDSFGDLNVDSQRKFKEVDGKAVEKDESVLARDQANKAKAGFPFFVECPRADQIAFIEDRSTRQGNGLAVVVYLRTVGLLDYREQLKQRDLDIGTVSINQYQKKVAVFTEREKPATFEPSGSRPDDWGQSVMIAQVWTRDELYELVAPSERGNTSNEWVLVRSTEHGYEMPPFAIVEADRYNSPDPARRYLPYLEGLYKLKPFVDYDNTVGRLLAHQIAMPFYWIKLADGSPMFDDAGNQVLLSHNSAAARAMPPGAELVKVQFDMNPAFLEFLNRAQEEMKEAAPETGQVDISASTQPWTIRLAQEISNSAVRSYKQTAANAIKTCVQNIMLIMQKPADQGGIGEPVPVYVRLKKGRVEEETLVAIDPEDIVSMQVEVDIAPNSTAQDIASQEHGRVLLADPNVPYPTQAQYLEDFVHIQDSDEQLRAFRAEQMYRERVEPAVVAQELASRFAELIVLGPDGAFIGAGGVQLQPEDVLEQNGATVTPPIDASVGAEGRSTMPLSDLQVNGAQPATGLPR